MSRALVVISGGIDSIVMAHLVKSRNQDLGLLFFDFEQEGTERELSCARLIASDFNVPLIT